MRHCGSATGSEPRCLRRNSVTPVLLISADVAIEDQVSAVVDLAVETFGRLDIMFNNAGILGSVGPIAEISAEGWHRTMDVLLSSVFLVSSTRPSDVSQRKRCELSTPHRQQAFEPD